MAIYCDESGFTGNDLLTKEQPYFSYIGVNIDPQKAEEYIKWFKKEFNIKSEEIKASQLLKRPNGRDAVSRLLKDFLPYSKIVVTHKIFSLSAKFFEYIFEPVLAKFNSVFYEHNFHLFITYAIFNLYKLKDRGAENLVKDFDIMMRNKGEEYTILFNDNGHDSDTIFLNKICEFASYHKDKIIEEFNSLGTIQKWILDDSLGSIYPILTHWTEEIGCLEVICDDSKPLSEERKTLAAWVGREDQAWQSREGRKWPLIAHLKKEISFVSSKQCPGVQIADVIASSVCYSFKNHENCSHASEWLPQIQKFIINAVFPDYEYYDGKSSEFALNTLVLDELVWRSQNNMQLGAGIGDFICTAKNIIDDKINNLQKKQMAYKDCDKKLKKNKKKAKRQAQRKQRAKK